MLSARQIAFLIGCRHSTINRALVNYGIKKTKQSTGWVEYGWKMLRGKRVRHTRQQKIIEQMVKRRVNGWSYKKITEHLNHRRITAPRGGLWCQTTVRHLIAKASAQMNLSDQS